MDADKEKRKNMACAERRKHADALRRLFGKDVEAWNEAADDMDTAEDLTGVLEYVLAHGDRRDKAFAIVHAAGWLAADMAVKREESEE